MKLILLAVIFLSAYSVMGATPPEQNIRVRLATLQGSLRISGLGIKLQNRSREYMPVAIPKASEARVRRIQINGKFVWAVQLNDQGIEQILHEPLLTVDGENLRLGGKDLPNKVLLDAKESLKIDVVGVVPLEDYVAGVLGSEMPANWPLETLKAQAVAARSYAVVTARERRSKTYHLDSTILDQVFQHFTRNNTFTEKYKKVFQAVQETKGQLLYLNNRQVLKAFFHADCGGQTTRAKNVWSTDVNSGVVIDRSCPSNPRGRWTLKLSQEDLRSKLQLENLINIELIKIPQEQRITRVRVALNDQKEKLFTINSFRQALGFQDLRSSIFELKKIGENYIFEGQGLGHGVGLCQWGSRYLGQSGKSYRQILSHYYPLALVQ